MLNSMFSILCWLKLFRKKYVESKTLYRLCAYISNFNKSKYVIENRATVYGGALLKGERPQRSHTLTNHVPRHETVFRVLLFLIHTKLPYGPATTLKMDFILKPDRKFSKAQDIV